MISAERLVEEVRLVRLEQAGIDPADTGIPFDDLPQDDRRNWEQVAEAVRRISTEPEGARPPSIPASVKDEQAMKLVAMARQSVELALAIAPNWTDSKLTVEDIQELERMRRRLLAMEID